jgi:hypothetical protein
MHSRIFRFLLIALMGVCISQRAWSVEDQLAERTVAALRVIGHELLLAAGDSTSRVLPIEKEGDRYQIQFASTFSFDPQFLSLIVDSTLKKRRIASSYLVEVKNCDSAKVVYSYEVDEKNEENFSTCKGRVQPEGCYLLLIRVISTVDSNMALVANKTKVSAGLNDAKHHAVFSSVIFYSVFVGFLICFIVVLRRRKKTVQKGEHLIKIGSYLFDRKNMTLLKGKDKQELTGKETDLLQLLFLHRNSTVDRDLILKTVWSDEGDYIGRTLDVYISKLRKKLEADPTISIVNIRGVGYRMTLN